MAGPQLYHSQPGSHTSAAGRQPQPRPATLPLPAPWGLQGSARILAAAAPTARACPWRLAQLPLNCHGPSRCRPHLPCAAPLHPPLPVINPHISVPNIPHLWSAYSVRSQIHLVQEWCAGGDLRAALAERQHGFPERVVAAQVGRRMRRRQAGCFVLGLRARGGLLGWRIALSPAEHVEANRRPGSGAASSPTAAHPCAPADARASPDRRPAAVHRGRDAPGRGGSP
jgi:hypothetical protein